jgi:hypothetical protein
VLLSQYVQPGSVNTTPYNHYSLLRSVEDLFGLSHLGYAGKSGLKAFGPDVFNPRPGGAPAAGGPGPAAPRGPMPCQSTRLRRGARGRLAPGTLIGSSRLVRGAGGTQLLEVTMSHAATLHIRVSGGARTRPIRRRVRACHTYDIKLPAGSRRVALVAAFHRARETRMVSG